VFNAGDIVRIISVELVPELDTVPPDFLNSIAEVVKNLGYDYFLENQYPEYHIIIKIDSNKVYYATPDQLELMFTI
jgi:hypothetical protein